MVPLARTGRQPIIRRVASRIGTPMIAQMVILGSLKVVAPVLLVRAAWWLLADLILERVDLPFV